MSNIHGKDTEVLMGDVDLSGFITDHTVQTILELGDVSAYKDEDRAFIDGLITGSVSLTGLFDGAASGSDEEIDNSLKTATLISVNYDGSTLGNVSKGIQVQTSDYNPQSPIGDVVVFGYTGQADIGIEHGFSFHAIANVETAAGEETRLDQAASSANGCAAFLHIVAFTGTDITIKLEDSANDSAWADLLTFTQATATTSERVTTTGTVDRYVKCSWTGTFSSCTFMVGMARH